MLIYCRLSAEDRLTASKEDHIHDVENHCRFKLTSWDNRPHEHHTATKQSKLSPMQL